MSDEGNGRAFYLHGLPQLKKDAIITSLVLLSCKKLTRGGFEKGFENMLIQDKT